MKSENFIYIVEKLLMFLGLMLIVAQLSINNNHIKALDPSYSKCMETIRSFNNLNQKETTLLVQFCNKLIPKVN